MEFFRQVQWAWKFSDATIQRSYTEAVKGTPLLPRDLFLMAIAGRMSAIALPDGKVIYSMASVQSITNSLDIIAQLQGQMLVRGPDFWQLVPTGLDGEVLTWDAATGLPAWAPGVAPGGYVPLTGGTMTGNLEIDGNNTGLLLKDSASSAGCLITDRHETPGHQVNVASLGPIGVRGAVVNVFAALATDATPNNSQVTLYTTTPATANRVEISMRTTRVGLFDECHIFTEKFGAGSIGAGAVVLMPNENEALRAIDGVGVLVTGHLGATGTASASNLSGTNTGDETSASILTKLGEPGTAGEFLNGIGTWTVPPGVREWTFNPPAAAHFTLASGDGTQLTLTNDSDIGLVIDNGTTVATSIVRYAYVTPPNGDWSVVARMWGDFSLGAGLYAGPIAVESATGKYYMVGLAAASQGTRRAWGTVAGVFTANADTNIPINGIWYRLSRKGLNITVEISGDGKSWANIWQSQALTTPFTSVPDRVGLGVLNRQAGLKEIISCSYWSQSF